MKSLVALSLFATLALSAQAQVLLTDTFDRGTTDAPLALDGSSPDFAASSETWTSSPNFTTNGTSANIAPVANAQDLAYIGIPGASAGLTIGDTYTLSFTIGPASGPSWLGAGFGDLSDTGSVSYGGGNTSSPLWALYNTDGSVAIFSGGGLLSITSATGTADVVTLSITAGTGNDLVSATVNGNSVTFGPTASLTTSVTAATIPDVFIDRYEDGGSFSNLTLTVPEPATWAMLMLGGLGLALLARTRLLKA